MGYLWYWIDVRDHSVVGKFVSEALALSAIDYEDREHLRLKRVLRIIWDYFESEAHKLAIGILNANTDFTNIIAINRGGLTLGVKLSHYLNIPLSVYTLPKLGCYDTAGILAIASLGKRTLIVDDINDTGNTLINIIKNMELYSIASETCTLVQKAESAIKVDYCNIVEPDDIWVEFPWERIHSF